MTQSVPTARSPERCTGKGPTSIALACLIAALFNARWANAADTRPRSLDPRLKIELFAEAPQIVTPTGLDVDHRGRVWAIESNTHFPPEGYQGHPSDRLLVFEDRDRDGQPENIVTFADGFTHAMSVSVRPPRPPSKLITVYVATRREIVVLTDEDGDLRSDRSKQIIRLDTPGNYPHNGLAGFAWDELGWMYFGLGENLGAEYRVIGSDGVALSGGGEGGSLYRCKPDGTQLTRWATGFWNPHASCFDAYGRMFTVDNDADSRPPCRLLHIVQDGDYGYRFRNGRKGLHPFTSWNGEIPGTLPMVAGTGEAPSGIVAYESDGLPQEYVGNLLVTSWGDHRIERFRLRPKGASYESLAEPLITGGEDFRPVGLAVAPDGSLFCTDWVLKDYKLHGKGRIWRVSMVEEPRREVVDVATITSPLPLERLNALLDSPRIDVRNTAATALSETAKGRQTALAALINAKRGERARLAALFAAVGVETAVEDFQLAIHDETNPRNIAHGSMHFDATVLTLLGMPQFAWDPKSEQLPPSDFLRRELADKHDEWDRTYGSIAAMRLLPNVAQSIMDHDRAQLLGDPFILSAAIAAVSRSNLDEAAFAVRVRQPSRRHGVLDETYWTRGPLTYLLGTRLKFPKQVEIAGIGLNHSDNALRRAAVQWVAEEKLKELRSDVEAVLSQEPMTADLFLATIAALEMLDGVDPANFDKTPAGKYVLPILLDAKRPPAVRSMALRLVSPSDPALKPVLASLLTSDDKALKLEAVRTLQASPLAEATKLLRGIARDESLDVNLRAEAIVGFAPAAAKKLDDETRSLLVRLLESPQTTLVIEALRALRNADRQDAQLMEAVANAGRRLANSDVTATMRKAAAEEVERLTKANPASPAARPNSATSAAPEEIAKLLAQVAEGGDSASGQARVLPHAGGRLLEVPHRRWPGRRDRPEPDAYCAHHEPPEAGRIDPGA